MPNDTDKLRQILSTAGPGINNRYAFDPMAIAQIEMMLQELERQRGIDATVRGEFERAEGLSPQARKTMEARAIESVPERLRAAERNLGTSLARRGLLTGATPASGMASFPLSELAAEREKFRAGSLRDVTLADEDLRQRNRMALLELLARRPGMNFPSILNTSGGGGGSFGTGVGGGGTGGGGGVGLTSTRPQPTTSEFAMLSPLQRMLTPSPAPFQIENIGGRPTGAFASNAERQAYNRLNSFAEYERSFRNPPLLGYLSGAGPAPSVPGSPRLTLRDQLLAKRP